MAGMRSEARVLPEPFLDRLRRILPPGRFDATANTFTELKPTTLRVNTLNTSAVRVREQLAELGFLCEAVPWYAEAFILRRGRLRELQTTPLYASGALYVQSLSSMLPPLVLQPQPGESVLDLTAAPGSKTTQLACLMGNAGRIVANDNNLVRWYKLKANVEQQGATMVEVSLRYGETFGRQHPAEFDRVLVDAPCSAEGRFLIHEPASFRFWKPAKVHEMAHKQQRLLRAGLEALRPGGVLVYSTCTFAPEENEGVVSSALASCGPDVSLEPIPFALTNRMPGLARWEDRTFHPSIGRTMRVLPTRDMEGFFIARFRKQLASREA